MTNSFAGALIEQVEHSCKYNDQGCEVKMMLKDLLVHERSCPEKLFFGVLKQLAEEGFFEGSP